MSVEKIPWHHHLSTQCQKQDNSFQGLDNTPDGRQRPPQEEVMMTNKQPRDREKMNSPPLSYK